MPLFHLTFFAVLSLSHPLEPPRTAEAEGRGDTAAPAAAAPLGSPHCSTRRLLSGNCLWLFAAADVQDASEMALLHHFVTHYTAMGIPPAHFLILVHARGPQGPRAAREATDWLQRAFGVRHSRVLLEAGERDSLGAFVKAVWRMLAEYVALQDWVLHVELDEFVAFPRDWWLGGLGSAHGPASLFDVHRFFDLREMQSHNIVYGFVVDRLAGAGMPDVVPGRFDQTLFDQFPLNCRLTYGMRRADVRRAVAYKGYLRVDIGHHIGLGACQDWNGNPVGPTSQELGGLLQGGLPSEVWSLSPYSGADAHVPVLRSWKHFATVYHFKWHSGLVQKMERTHRKGWFPVRANEGDQLMSDILELAKKRSRKRRKFVNDFCVNATGGAKLALPAAEQVRFITLLEKDEWRAMLNLQKVKGQDIAFWEEETWNFALYEVFMFAFSYNISDFVNMMSKLKW